MVSLEGASISDEPTSSPRISFSSEFLDEENFISITPNTQAEKERKDQQERARNAAEFEFLSSKLNNENMITADKLFFEGKLRPYWQIHYTEKLNKTSLKTEHAVGEIFNEADVKKSKEETRPINWFIDEDPSPRPPKCTVLWRELLRLKQKRASSLSPSSSTSSSSSSGSLADISVASNQEKNKGQGTKEKHVKRIKKGLERNRSDTLRVRPVIHVPICTQGKKTALPPVFSLKEKGRAIER